MVKKRGLGKGLSALIPENPMADILDSDLTKESILDLDIDSIEPNKDQPRKNFKEDSLRELASSIKAHGVIQPIVVRRQGSVYQIIAGERRWRAAKVARLKKIPCIIKDVDQINATKLALIENIQREDLNPIEEAYAFQGLMEEYGLTQEEVAKAIGKSRSYIANSVRLLKLDGETKDYIAEGKISRGHGRALLGIKDERERKKVVRSVVEENINVRDTEKMIKNSNEFKAKTYEEDQIHEYEEDPMIREIEDNLMRTLGTKVKLITRKDRGKIEIEFYDHEDLERIIELIID